MRVASLLVALSTASAAAAYEHPSRVRRGETPDGKVAPGTTNQCTYYFTTTSKDNTCTFIEGYWGVGHKDFVAWNPAVKEDCSGIEIGYSYCVDVNHGGTITAPPTSTLPPVPSPTLAGIAKDCDKYHLIVKGDTCGSVTAKYGISMDQLTAWNTAVDKDCGGFWAAYYCCVHIVGAGTSSPGSTPTTSDPVPAPHQTGIAKDCDKFYQVVKGDTCDSVTAKFGISTDQLIMWNSAIDKDCNGFWAGYYICVKTKGSTPTSPTSSPPTTSAGPTAPGPTQTGITSDCRDWYVAKPGDYCDKIVQGYSNFDKDTFIKWNPAVGKDCAGIWVKYAYCVGTQSKPAKLVKPPTECTTPHPTPTQPGAICQCKKWHLIKAGDNCWSLAQQYKVSENDIKKWNPGTDCNLWVKYNVCVGA
ncbi:LysM domain protein [Cordyceps militaris]|uniref:LysM domain protein n=1 Tax=Cordyceps militaris TaxID=73501 RepID=A0A2H4SGH2_CORMI|nr:LysM domain protein [Cordyceps militaris]